MTAFNRKTTPRVKRGRVQKKNNWTETASYYNMALRYPVVDRKRPGPGYRHILKQKDLHEFIGILPDWQELSKGLNAVVLAPGEWRLDGYYDFAPGVVHICAWESRLWTQDTPDYYDDHHDIYERLGVPCERHDGHILCKWTHPTARAYQLLHIFLHELGHHHDHITSKTPERANRGESYAEAYAREYQTRIWERYISRFGLD